MGVIQRILSLIFCVVVVAGCSRKIAPTTTITSTTNTVTEKEDSTWSDIPKVKEFTENVAGTIIRVPIYIHCDSSNHITPIKETIKKGNATIDLNIDKNGKGTINVTCDSLQKIIKEQTQLIHHLQKEKTTTIRTVERRIPVITHEPYWYDMAARWIAGTVLLILIIFIGYQVLKQYAKYKNPLI
jgi:PBP1b-binding outer membrane lipoprotein LpoB